MAFWLFLVIALEFELKVKASALVIQTINKDIYSIKIDESAL